MRYTISEAAQKCSLSAHVLRYYEKEGVLPAVHRSKGGIRYYTEEDLETLGLICCLKKTGMQLSEIKAFVLLGGKDEASLKERCEILRRQKENVERQIEELKQSYDKVSRKLEHYTRLLENFAGADQN